MIARFMVDSPENDGAPRRLLVIYNPTAGGSRRQRFEAVLAGLADLGCPLDVRPTSGPGDAAALARAVDPAAYDLVVAAGGDGTINEVVNGMVGAAGSEVAAGPAPPPLAVLPLGTANVLAAELGLDLVPAHIARVIARGPVREVSLGRASAPGRPARVFSLMAGAGFDARVVDSIDLRVKRLLGKGAYVLEGFRQMCLKKPPLMRVTVDGETHEAASVIVSNARFYGGRYLLAPQASLEDPLLHVCLFRHGDTLSILRYAMALQRGRLLGTQGFEIVTGQDIRIEGDPGAPLQADGDIIARLPVRIAALPRALRMVTAG
ncbi:diacylglycerol/lipid kinase family protein [Pelagibius marinus]|uniref:diacylglycerol/lipid kinase family protein n=1 Tax=Pelagibius marinus TaxID=2762760 RepID=UPI0018730BF0|nr:diacylglycerol kinase family protein [Pelagibius marinus]